MIRFESAFSIINTRLEHIISVPVCPTESTMNINGSEIQWIVESRDLWLNHMLNKNILVNILKEIRQSNILQVQSSLFSCKKMSQPVINNDTQNSRFTSSQLLWAILFLEIESWNEKKEDHANGKIYLVEFHSNKKQNITPFTSGEYILIFSWIGVYITLYLYGKED